MASCDSSTNSLHIGQEWTTLSLSEFVGTVAEENSAALEVGEATEEVAATLAKARVARFFADTFCAILLEEYNGNRYGLVPTVHSSQLQHSRRWGPLVSGYRLEDGQQSPSAVPAQLSVSQFRQAGQLSPWLGEKIHNKVLEEYSLLAAVTVDHAVGF